MMNVDYSRAPHLDGADLGNESLASTLLAPVLALQLKLRQSHVPLTDRLISLVAWHDVGTPVKVHYIRC